MEKTRKGQLVLALAAGVLIGGVCASHIAISYSATPMTEIAPESGESTFAGDFLGSHFAQSQYDWKRANTFLDGVLMRDPQNYDLIKRSMILAMGSGALPVAAQRARDLLAGEADNNLALMILGIDAFSRGKAEDAVSYFDKMPSGDMSDFLKPLLKGWAEAAAGRAATAKFNETTIHLYHAALMALARNDKATAEKYTKSFTATSGLNAMEAERAGDLWLALGKKEKAVAVYNALLKKEPDSARLKDKVATAESGNPEAMRRRIRILDAGDIAEQSRRGAALSMLDMAGVLYQEYSDSSAILFLHMALALDPGLVDARILLGEVLSRNGRDQDAISYYLSVPEDDQNHLESQRHAADMMAESGRLDDALALLNKLAAEKNDIESLIRIGDLYRQAEKFTDALKAYNRAADALNGKIPEEFWYLLYARGMAHERLGNWAAAEKDLEAALTFRPDHPYLLNYLGYGWADKGLNLDKSLELVRKASSLRPSDGYITDSLGWVLYMLGHYEEAVPHLEKAVELLPYDTTINDHLGDVYWRTGRKMEAHFQWERAYNNAENEAQKQAIQKKLSSGLEPEPALKQAAGASAGQN